MKYLCMLLYLLVNAYDARMTILGLEYTKYNEWGLITAPWVELIGPVWGVIVAKLSFVPLLCVAVLLTDYAYRMARGKSVATTLFIIGSICTLIGGSLWISI